MEIRCANVLEAVRRMAMPAPLTPFAIWRPVQTGCAFAAHPCPAAIETLEVVFPVRGPQP